MNHLTSILQQGIEIERTLSALFRVDGTQESETAQGISHNIEVEIQKIEEKIISILVSSETLPSHKTLEYKSLLVERFRQRNKLIQILALEGKFEIAQEKIRDFKIQNFFIPSSWDEPSLKEEQKHWQRFEDDITNLLQKNKDQ